MPDPTTHKWSPSQIKTATECVRKWFFGSVLKIRMPSNKSAQLGSDCHTVFESYLLTGNRTWDPTRPELGKITFPALQFLPDPAKNKTIQVERTFTLVRSGLVYTGRKDLEYQPEDGIFTTTDHKTTSNMVYALKPSDLQEDPQGILYGLEAVEHKGLESVRLQWIYSSTRAPYRAVEVSTVMTKPKLREGAEVLDWFVKKKLLPLLDVADPKEVDYNPSTCGKYGGCPYLSMCNLSPVERMRGAFQRKA